MRYLGGMLGGTWLTALTGDLGHGNFDGANLIANFEAGNPANTYWQKAYNVFSKIDTEPERFIDFETWWGIPGAPERARRCSGSPTTCSSATSWGKGDPHF